MSVVYIIRLYTCLLQYFPIHNTIRCKPFRDPYDTSQHIRQPHPGRGRKTPPQPRRRRHHRPCILTTRTPRINASNPRLNARHRRHGTRHRRRTRHACVPIPNLHDIALRRIEVRIRQTNLVILEIVHHVRGPQERVAKNRL